MDRVSFKVVSLGRPATFYIPSAKWNNPKFAFRGKTIGRLVNEFLIGNYNGYTVRGPFLGFWRASKYSNISNEAVMEVTASFKGKERIPKLQKFLSGMCRLMQEECLYLQTGEDSFLIYP